MDFITDLPESEGCQNMIVITDRLGKGVVADGLDDLEAETVAKWFIRRYYPHHFLPFAIVSDRGAQFTGALWTRICRILRIKRRLSTAFSPETDGSTERMN
jgi:transposase InsO family protein